MSNTRDSAHDVRWLLAWFAAWALAVAGGITIGEYRADDRVEQMRRVVTEEMERQFQMRGKLPR